MYACMHALRYYHYPLLTLPEVVITFFLETNVTFGKLDWGNNPSKYMLYTYSGVHESVGCMQHSLTATKSHAIHLLQSLGGKKEKGKKERRITFIHPFHIPILCDENPFVSWLATGVY